MNYSYRRFTTFLMLSITTLYCANKITDQATIGIANNLWEYLLKNASKQFMNNANEVKQYKEQIDKFIGPVGEFFDKDNTNYNTLDNLRKKIIHIYLNKQNDKELTEEDIKQAKKMHKEITKQGSGYNITQKNIQDQIKRVFSNKDDSENTNIDTADNKVNVHTLTNELSRYIKKIQISNNANIQESLEEVSQKLNGLEKTLQQDTDKNDIDNIKKDIELSVQTLVKLQQASNDDTQCKVINDILKRITEIAKTLGINIQLPYDHTNCIQYDSPRLDIIINGQIVVNFNKYTRGSVFIDCTFPLYYNNKTACKHIASQINIPEISIGLMVGATLYSGISCNLGEYVEAKHVHDNENNNQYWIFSTGVIACLDIDFYKLLKSKPHIVLSVFCKFNLYQWNNSDSQSSCKAVLKNQFQCGLMLKYCINVSKRIGAHIGVGLCISRHKAIR